jgi:hypothetical protein
MFSRKKEDLKEITLGNFAEDEYALHRLYS